MSIGRLLQMLGLVILPVGLLHGIEQESMTIELLSLCIGAGVFMLGRWLDPGKR